MNNITSRFSVTDLENLSGVKAHTIRVWEKRYGVLSPDRNSQNTRSYDGKNLKKLLNVTRLYNSGLKISKIASLEDDELQLKVRDLIDEQAQNGYFMDSFKVAMLTFDQKLFDDTYNKYVAGKSFRTVFLEVFVPMLYRIGLDWQSDSITPAHEHFMSNLVRQKVSANIDRVSTGEYRSDVPVCVLYLPENEFHEIGLMYMHYELLLKGYHSIFLGQSLPSEHLKTIQSAHSEVRFISCLTIDQGAGSTDSYLAGVKSLMEKGRNDSFWLIGNQVEMPQDLVDNDQFKFFDRVPDALNQIF